MNTASQERAGGGTKPAWVLAAGIVALGPWPLGSVHPEAIAAFALLAALLVLALGAQPPHPGGLRVPARLVACGVALLLGLALVQLLPLGSLLDVLSPATSRLRDPFVPPEATLELSCVSFYPQRTREMTLALAVGAALLLTTAGLRSQRGARTIAGAWVGSAALNAFVGSVAFLNGETLFWVTGSAARASGSYPSPNHFAGLLAVSLPMALCLAGVGLPKSRRQPVSPAWVLAAGALALGILLSASRSGAIATVAGALTYALLVGPRARGVVYAGSLIGFLLLLVGLNPLTERFMNVLTEDGETLRIELWRLAWDLFCEFPSLGAGLRTHEQLTPALLAMDRLDNASHNDFLNLLADTGLAGGALALVTLLGFVAHVRHSARALQPGSARTVLAAGTGGVAALLAASLFEFNLQIPANLWAFAVAAGLALAAPNLARPTRTSPPEERSPKRLTLLFALAAVCLGGAGLRVGVSRLLLWRASEPSAEPRTSLLASAEAWAPEDADVSRALGRAHLDEGDAGQAVEAFARACAKEPRNPLHHTQLARALLSAQRPARAEEELELAAELAPEFTRVQLHLGFLWLWRGRQAKGTAPPQAATRSRALTQAQAAFRRALRWDPGWANAIVDALLTYPGAGVRDLEPILPPETPAVRRWLAADLARRKLPEDAERVLAPLVEDPAPEATDLVALGRVQLLQSRGEEAATSFRRAIERVDPDRRHETLSQAWRALERAGFARLGEEVCQEAAERWPSSPAVQRELGLSLLANDRPVEAIEALERSLNSGLAISGVELGRAYLRLGRKEFAAGVWERTLPRLSHGRASLQLELSALLVELGDRDKALSTLRRARRQAPNDRRLREALERLER